MTFFHFSLFLLLRSRSWNRQFISEQWKRPPPSTARFWNNPPPPLPPPSPPPSLSFLSAWKWHLSPFPIFDPNQFSQYLICVFLIWDFGGKGLYQWPRAKGNLESHTFRFLTIKCVASATSLQNWYSWEEVEGGIYNNMSQRRNFFYLVKKLLGPKIFIWITWLGCLLHYVSLFASHLLSQKFEFCPRTQASSNLEKNRLNLDKGAWPWKILKIRVLFS